MKFSEFRLQKKKKKNSHLSYQLTLSAIKLHIIFTLIVNGCALHLQVGLEFSLNFRTKILLNKKKTNFEMYD